MSGLYLETCTSNLKSVALTVLELLAFNAQKFRGSRDCGYTPFQKKILRSHIRTVSGNMQVKFDIRSFNLFGVICILTPILTGLIDRSAARARTHRDRQKNKTHIKRTHCLRHSLRSLGGDNK